MSATCCTWLTNRHPKHQICENMHVYMSLKAAVCKHGVLSHSMRRSEYIGNLAFLSARIEHRVPR